MIDSHFVYIHVNATQSLKTQLHQILDKHSESEMLTKVYI